MKFEITIALAAHKRILPISYQYELSSAIYKILEGADAQYSLFLHEKGYKTARKSFKLFVFSNLHIFPFRCFNDRIEIGGNEVSFQISFYMDKTAENFIMGLFKEQNFSLGDKINQVPFIVKQIQAIALPEIGEKIILRPLSPVVVGKKNNKGYDDYLSPEHPEFGDLLILNLIDKYQSSGQQIPLDWQDAPIHFELLEFSKLKSKLITIKTGTKEETKVRGFGGFTFLLTAPKELIEIALLAGIGKENAMGFGYVDVVRE